MTLIRVFRLFRIRDKIPLFPILSSLGKLAQPTSTQALNRR